MIASLQAYEVLVSRNGMVGYTHMTRNINVLGGTFEMPNGTVYVMFAEDATGAAAQALKRAEQALHDDDVR